jgi:exodeoxyribonuclease V gamma subunit
MPGLILHTSNQLDLLARRLSEVVADPLASPFTPEIVVVQSLATRRWLTFEIAQNQRICANYAFPFLSNFTVWLVKLGSRADTLVEKTPPELLAWRIDSLLLRSLKRKEFAPLARYLRDGDALKRFHLAIRLANLFDQYRVYRPEMISDWGCSDKKRSGDEAWQASLWRQLDEISAFDQALQRLRASGFKNEADLPERVSIFAPGSLPPACLDLLFQLSQVRDVHLFLFRPSAEYRGNDVTPKQRARRRLTASDSTAGNPLATSWGKLDVELTDLLLEKEERLGAPITYDTEEFIEYKEDTLLGAIQADILVGRNRGAATGIADGIPALSVKPDDRSLTLHACYSPMREVEVLYDQLLDCFERMPDLQPRDILVMTPAIETYAPFIQAVFRYPEDKSMWIPYSLADRHPRSESQTIDTFLSLLQLPGSRYTASQIFGLLGSRSIKRRFRLSDEELSTIRDWIDQTKIRWGIDSEHRKRLGLPDLNTNTWRYGLQRLLLGYAMEGNDRLLFEGILPHDDVEGDGGDLLGRFATAAEALFQLTEELERPRPLAEWANPLTKLIDQFFDPIGEEDVRDVRFLRLIIDQLRTLRGEHDANVDVEYAVVRQYLEGQVATLEQHGTFFSTGITFCALKPARGIPARVVCLLGINDQIFPRRPEHNQFDLMAQTPQAGDPSPRQDDRYSFLQAILAAKEQLIVSYIGRSAIHNQQIPPSVVVSELLDYANQAFVFPEKKSAREFLVTEHPLQAFSPRYFVEPRDDSRLFGYSQANAAASRTISLSPASEVHPFITEPLPQLEEPLRNLELRELIDFWKHPSKYFVRQRLGLNLRDRGFSLDDDEPFVPTALEMYPLKQELLAQELDREALPFELFEARGILASGAIGQLQLKSMRGEMEKLAQKVGEKIGDGKKDPPVSIDLILPGYTLTGTIENIYGGKAVFFRPANLSPKDYLRAWVEHLALCLHNQGNKTETLLIGRDGQVTFDSVSSATAALRTFCDLYLEGLSKPLRFFPMASMAFAEATISGRGDPIKKAREKWDGPYRRVGKREGEKDDSYFKLCFDGLDPFADPFAEIALKVFETMLSHLRPNDV